MNPTVPGTSVQVVMTGVAVGIGTTNIFPTAGVFLGQAAQEAWITLEGNDARYHFGGLTPAPSCGHILLSGSAFRLEGFGAINNFKIVCTSSSTATMLVTLSFG
jgi:hypothetical protein